MPPLGLRPLPYRKVARRLRDFGFAPVRQRGSHVRFAHADGRSLTVPRHGGDDIARGTLLALLEEGAIDPDAFFTAFR